MYEVTLRDKVLTVELRRRQSAGGVLEVLMGARLIVWSCEMEGEGGFDECLYVLMSSI